MNVVRHGYSIQKENGNNKYKDQISSNYRKSCNTLGLKKKDLLYVVKPGVDIYAPRHYDNRKKEATQYPYKPFSQNVSNSLDHEISIIKNDFCNVIYTSKIIDPIGQYIKKEIFGLDIIKKSFIGTSNSSEEKAVKDLENGYFLFHAIDINDLEFKKGLVEYNLGDLKQNIKHDGKNSDGYLSTTLAICSKDSKIPVVPASQLRVGFVLDPSKTIVHHADFKGIMSWGRIEEESKKKGYNTQNPYSKDVLISKHETKKGFGRYDDHGGWSHFVVNHAKWDANNKVWNKYSSLDTFAENLKRRFFYFSNGQNSDKETKKDREGYSDGKKAIYHNELLVEQKYIGKKNNPMQGLFLDITDVNQITNPELLFLQETLAKYKNLNLYFYDRKAQNMVVCCQNSYAIKILDKGEDYIKSKTYIKEINKKKYQKIDDKPAASPPIPKTREKRDKLLSTTNIIGLQEDGVQNITYAGNDRNYYIQETIKKNNEDTVFVFGGNAEHTKDRAASGNNQAASTGGNENVFPIMTMGDISDEALENYNKKTQVILEKYVGHGGKVVFPLTKKDGSVNVGTGIALQVAGEKKQKFINRQREWADNLYNSLKRAEVTEKNPEKAMQQYHYEMNRLQKEMKARLTASKTPTPKVEGESAEEEAKKKNKIQFLQDENITNVESFMQWNKDSYKKLKVDPANEYNLKLFLNPKTEYGKKVFAGWGGSLSHEKDSIFNIDNVIDGGFANKISLTEGNKIEIDLNHKDFQKDGKQFEGKMLEAALINKLRAGNLEGIKKIGYINVDKNTEKIKKIYEKHIKIFSKNNGQTNYSTVKGPSEIELEEEDRKFFTSLETEKTVDKVEEELKKTAEIKLHEFINKSYQEYVKNHYKDNEKRKTGIYNKGSEKQKPLIIFPIGTRDVGGGGDEEAKNNYKSYTKYLKDNNMSVSSRNVYSVVSYGQYHWEFLKFQDNEEKPEKITNTGGGDNACGAYTLVGIITDDKELGNKLNINDLEENTKKTISKGDAKEVSKLPATEVRKIIKHLLTEQAKQAKSPEEKKRIEESINKRVEKSREMIEIEDLESACEAIGIAFCTVHDFDPIQQKKEYFNNLFFDDNNIKTTGDLYKKFKTENPTIDEEIIKRAIIELKDNQNLTQSEKLNIKQIKEDQLESGKYNLQAKLIENLTNEGKIKLQDIIYQISSQESLLINDNKDNTIKTDKILSNKKPQLIAEDNHLTDHKENINNLIEKIKNGQIGQNSIIALERKEGGNNFGMKDVKILAKILQDDNLEKIIPEEIKNSPIYDDALLYNEAKAKGVKVVGIEGKDLETRKKINEKDHNQKREDIMADNLILLQNQYPDSNIISLIGSDHKQGIEKRLKDAYIPESEKTEVKQEVRKERPNFLQIILEEGPREVNKDYGFSSNLGIFK